MATWPVTLPQSFEARSYDTSPASGVIRTDMDAGQAKTRARFTAVTKNHSGSMIMTKTLFDGDFLTFFNTTILFGSVSFDFPEPFTGSTISVRFVIPNGGSPYRARQSGPLNVEIAFTLEELP